MLVSQALTREIAQPDRLKEPCFTPLKSGRGATMTHDCKRNGTTTLFGALNVLDGSVIGRNMQRHCQQEFIRFLKAIEAELPPDKAVHVILDSYATHKQPKVRAWLARHPRWTFHFVPTSCSWLNPGEGFFAKLTRRRRKNGVFRFVVDLKAAINRFINEHNEQPKPFVWRAGPDEIIAAVKRRHQTSESIHERSARAACSGQGAPVSGKIARRDTGMTGRNAPELAMYRREELEG